MTTRMEVREQESSPDQREQMTDMVIYVSEFVKTFGVGSEYPYLSSSAALGHAVIGGINKAAADSGMTKGDMLGAMGTMLANAMMELAEHDQTAAIEFCAGIEKIARKQTPDKLN